jgi:hypothetical protein
MIQSNRPLEGTPPAPSLDHGKPPLNEAGLAQPGAISTRDLIEPIFMRTVYVGVIAPLLFAYLGSLGALAPYNEESQWLVSKLAPIWPVLPSQYELVLKIRGVGHATSYGFMCATLCVWPLICAAAFLWGHARRGKEILPISPKEIGQFIVAFPFGVLVLVFDRTKVTGMYGFNTGQWSLYLEQWFVFAITSLIVAILLYMTGRIILDRTRPA